MGYLWWQGLVEWHCTKIGEHDSHCGLANPRRGLFMFGTARRPTVDNAVACSKCRLVNLKVECLPGSKKDRAMEEYWKQQLTDEGAE